MTVRRRMLFAMLWLAALAAAPALAHEVRPGFLELREQTDGSYSMLWKQPSGGEVEIRIAPVFPEGLEKILTVDEIMLLRKYRQVTEEGKTQINGYVEFMFASKRNT